MANFCKSCGASLEDGARFCGNCGTSVDAVASTPVAAAQKPADLTQYVKFILIGLALIALTFAVLNFGGFYDVKATISYGELSQSGSGAVSDLYKEDHFTILAVGNYASATLLVLSAAAAILGILRAFKVSDISNKIFKCNCETKEFKFASFWGMIALVFHVFCFLLTGANDMGGNVKVSVAAPWYSWFAMVLFVGAWVFCKFVLNKKKDV